MVVIHRNVDGEHEETPNCWCKPLVLAPNDPRFDELVSQFDRGA